VASFAEESSFGKERALVPLDDARREALAMFTPLPIAYVPLGQCLGLVLAEDIRAPHPVPSFANSAMDGYAVRAEDATTAPVRLEVVGHLPAGRAPAFVVGKGQAARIMTGAPMPPGADAVAVLEATRAIDHATVELLEPVRTGDNVRLPGEDLPEGSVVLEAGTLLGPAQLGVAASIGLASLPVRRKPRVGVLSSGDELAGPGDAPLEPGRIRDANRPALLALAEESGCEAVDLGIVPDDEDALRSAVLEAAATCDVLLTSGGVSLGDHDHMRSVLEGISRTAMHWLEVAIKPAKPLALGTVQGTPVVGLPGNPVSALVSFELFARPGLRTMLGDPVVERPRTKAVALEALRRRPDGKLHLVRVQVRPGEDGRLVARSAGGQGSHQLGAMARANALVLLEDGTGVDEGDLVDVMLLGPWR